MAYINGKKVMFGRSVRVSTNVETQEKTIDVTENGELTITPDEDKDGLSKVIIKTNVPQKYGRGIEHTEINASGELVVYYTDSTSQNLGKVVGAAGKDGENGANGQDGEKGDKGDKGEDGQDGIDGADGRGIEHTEINASGELVIYFNDGTSVNLGKVVGADGKDGENGTNGAQGEKGEKGEKGDKGDKGEDGQDGIDGADGRGIERTEINAGGELVVYYTDSTSQNLGEVVGADGKDGANGQDGEDGRGIERAEVTADGELIIYYTDKTNQNLGKVVGSNALKEYYTKTDADNKFVDKTANAEVVHTLDNKVNLLAGNVQTINDLLEERFEDVDLPDATEESPSLVFGDNGAIYVKIARFSYNMKDDGTYELTFNTSQTGRYADIPPEVDGVQVTSIKEKVFEDNRVLLTATIPYTVKTIGDEAFLNCPSLRLVTIAEGVKSIGNKTFSHSGIESIEIPEGVTAIGESAFSYCENLTSAKLPQSITSTSYGMFAGCRILKTVDLPNTITVIEDRTFQSCFELDAIVIPNSVVTIGAYAFCYCDALTSIEIPSSVTTIKSYAFMSCGQLTDIQIKATAVPTLENVNAFTGISDSAVFTVPKGTLSAYQSAPNWSELAAIYTFTEAE